MLINVNEIPLLKKTTKTNIEEKSKKKKPVKPLKIKKANLL